jgi:hypothetical protein
MKAIIPASKSGLLSLVKVVFGHSYRQIVGHTNIQHGFIKVSNDVRKIFVMPEEHAPKLENITCLRQIPRKYFPSGLGMTNELGSRFCGNTSLRGLGKTRQDWNCHSESAKPCCSRGIYLSLV